MNEKKKRKTKENNERKIGFPNKIHAADVTRIERLFSWEIKRVIYIFFSSRALRVPPFWAVRKKAEKKKKMSRTGGAGGGRNKLIACRSYPVPRRRTADKGVGFGGGPRETGKRERAKRTAGAGRSGI